MWLHRPSRRNRPHEREAGHMLRRTILIISLILAVPALGYGKGQQEDILTRADELIEQKRYNEALGLLTPFMRENPRKFDPAQKRIKLILAIKEEYNNVANLLLDEMEKEEPDNPTILELSNRLFELDPERIAETQDFINRVREVAQFRANMRRLERVLTEGQDLIDQGRYVDALRKYTEALPIYQEEFFTGPYPVAMQGRARQAINSINNNIAPVTSAATALEEAVKALEALSGQGIEAPNLVTYRAAYNRLATEMDRFTALRNTFAASDQVFRDDLVLLRRDFPQLGDRNFLAFAVRVMEGRGEQGGMLNVFDTVWAKAVPRARELLDQKSQTVYAAIVFDASSQEYARLGARSDTLDAYSSFPEDLEIRWGNYELAQKETIFTRPIPVAEAGNFLKFSYLKGSSAQWRTLGQLGNRYLAVPRQDSLNLWRGGRNGDELIRAEQNNVSTLRQIRSEAAALLNGIQQESSRYQALENRFPNSGAMTYRDGVNKATEDLINLINIFEEDSSYQRYTIANGMIADRLALRDEQFREGRALFDGTQREEYLAKFPTQAAALLAQMDTAYEADRQALQGLIGQYNAEPGSLTAGPRIQPLRNEAATMLARLDSTRAQGRTLATQARAQSTDAANFRRDGDRLFQEAQQALGRNEFTTALTRVDQSARAYDESLDREYDEATWNMRNNQLDELSKTISRLFNEEVMRQVTELVSQIQDYYYSSEFERAEQAISRAQNIWRQTQSEPNPSLVYWTQMIAEGIRSGRNIPPTAPLYAEMSQLLSDARRNFEEGSALYPSREGERRLNSAKQNIDKVKLVYPMNEDAGILGLRIDSLLDPNFIVTLNTRVNGFINTTKNGTAGARIQAVNDLRNYRVVFLEYRNDWDPIITQAEIDAGLRRRPPTAAEIAEAQDIVNRAERIIAGNDIEAIKTIMVELDRATRLNPDNRRAKTLFDEGTRKVMISQLVLDREAEQLFQAASAALQQNNAIRAQQLLREIYARNPLYRYVTKVQTLQIRVDTAL